MKARAIVGKRIAKVHQSYASGDNGVSGWMIDAIEFTDGTFMQFLTVELGCEYAIEPIYPAKPPTEHRSH